MPGTRPKFPKDVISNLQGRVGHSFTRVPFYIEGFKGEAYRFTYKNETFYILFFHDEFQKRFRLVVIDYFYPSGKYQRLHIADDIKNASNSLIRKRLQNFTYDPVKKK